MTIAGTTEPPTINWMIDVVSMTFLRGHRSAATPAGSSHSRVPTIVALPTMPAFAADPVSARISSG